MKLNLKTKGELKKTKRFLEKALKLDYTKVLDECGRRGVEALQQATPKRTGRTAASWRYELERDGDIIRIFWTNDNRTKDGDAIAILLQYGHGTGNGGYVRGRDYINPAIKPVFDDIADVVWKVMNE